MQSLIPSSHWDLPDTRQDFCPSVAAPELPGLEFAITSCQPRAEVKQGFKNNLERCCNTTCKKEVGCSPNWGKKFLFQCAKCETEGKTRALVLIRCYCGKLSINSPGGQWQQPNLKHVSLTRGTAWSKTENCAISRERCCEQMEILSGAKWTHTSHTYRLGLEDCRESQER